MGGGHAEPEALEAGGLAARWSCTSIWLSLGGPAPGQVWAEQGERPGSSVQPVSTPRQTLWLDHLGPLPRVLPREAQQAQERVRQRGDGVAEAAGARERLGLCLWTGRSIILARFPQPPAAARTP